MRAYLYSMAMICVNLGFIIIASLGIFRDSAKTSVWVSTLYDHPELAYGVMMLFTLSIALAGFKFFGSGTSSGGSITSLAMVAFITVYWASFLSTFELFNSISLGGDIKVVILGTFTGISALIFYMTIIQMATGGQKSYD